MYGIDIANMNSRVVLWLLIELQFSDNSDNYSNAPKLLTTEHPSDSNMIHRIEMLPHL